MIEIEPAKPTKRRQSAWRWLEGPDYSKTCDKCGFKREAGDYVPDALKAHREYHRVHFPAPEPRLDGLGTGDVRVNLRSDRWLNLLVYYRARAFKRECGHAQQWPWPMKGSWHRPGSEDMRGDWHAWLLVEPGHIPVGVVAFKWMEWTNVRHGWHLLWAWVALEYRRSGVLTRRWPAWVARYGWFTVESPVSPAMEAFLFKARHRTALAYSEDPITP
jgi:hypothetical protein